MTQHSRRPPQAFAEPIYVSRPLLPDLDRYRDRLRDIWDAQWLTNAGASHLELERQLSTLLQAPHLSLFNNGTMALSTALKALELSGEVITTPFTFSATVHALSWIGLTPVFADIDATTMTIDPACVEALVTPRTTAILGVHVYGIPCDVEAIEAIARRYGLKVIYDGAHAFKAKTHGRPIASFGDLTMLSFHATKLFHTAEGGALICRDATMKRKIDILKNFGIADEVSVLMPGTNGKMNELQAALGLLTLEMVPQERKQRQRVSAIYHSRLSGIAGLSFPLPEDEHEAASFQYFPIRIDALAAAKSRDLLHAELKAFNIITRRYFYPLCSDYPCYQNLASAATKRLPVAQRVASEVLVLPFYGALGDAEVHQICDIIRYVMES